MRKIVNVVLAFILAVAPFWAFMPQSAKADLAYSYYIQFNVTDNSGLARTYVPVITGINITSLINQGYLNSQATDIDVQLSDGTAIPFTVRNDNLNIVIPSLLALETKQIYLYMTASPTKTQFDIVPGTSGNVTFADNTSLRISSNFSQNITDYTNASQTISIINKPNRYSLNVSGGLLYATYYGASYTGNVTSENLSVTANGSVDNVTTVFGAATHWQAVETNDGDTTYIQVGTSFNVWEQDLFELGNCTGSGNAPNVTIYAVAKFANVSGAPLRAVLSIGGNVTTGNTSSVTSAGYTTYNLGTWSSNPNTGQNWTQSDINSGQFGIETYYTASGQNARITQVYTTVTYGANTYTVALSTPITTRANPIGIVLASSNLSLYLNGVVANSTAVDNVTDGTGSVTINGSSSNIIYTINGTRVLWYAPTTYITGTVLPDRSNYGNTGTINWGTNPTTLNISVGSVVNVLDRIPTVLSVAVFQNYISTGDMLITAEIENEYPPYYPSSDPRYYFQIQLISSDNTTVIAAVPQFDWGTIPVSIYLNPTMAANIAYNTTYYLRVQANFATRVTGQATINGTNWKGSVNSTAFDNWATFTAEDMETADNATGYTVRLADGSKAITDDISGKFLAGIPGIAQIRPNLFTTSKLSPSFTQGTSNNTFDASNWTSYVGTSIATDVATVAAIFGGTGRDALAMLVMGAIAVIVIMGTTSMGGVGAIGLFVLSIPLLWVATYFRIIGVQWITILSITCAYLAIRQLWIKTT